MYNKFHILLMFDSKTISSCFPLQKGLLHEKKNEFHEAQTCYQNALAINPYHLKSLRHLVSPLSPLPPKKISLHDNSKLSFPSHLLLPLIFLPACPSFLPSHHSLHDSMLTNSRQDWNVPDNELDNRSFSTIFCCADNFFLSQ